MIHYLHIYISHNATVTHIHAKVLESSMLHTDTASNLFLAAAYQEGIIIKKCSPCLESFLNSSNKKLSLDEFISSIHKFNQSCHQNNQIILYLDANLGNPGHEEISATAITLLKELSPVANTLFSGTKACVYNALSWKNSEPSISIHYDDIMTETTPSRHLYHQLPFSTRQNSQIIDTDADCHWLRKSIQIHSEKSLHPIETNTPHEIHLFEKNNLSDDALPNLTPSTLPCHWFDATVPEPRDNPMSISPKTLTTHSDDREPMPSARCVPCRYAHFFSFFKYNPTTVTPEPNELEEPLSSNHSIKPSEWGSMK